MKKRKITLNWVQFFNKATAAILNTVQHCALCDKPSKHRICHNCSAYFSVAQYTCQTCAVPLKHHAMYCGHCLKSPPHYDVSYSPYLYQAPLSHLISDFKHKGHLFVGKGLGELFYTSIRSYYCQQHLPLPDLIAPVPLHWKKQWQRGFNQSAFLGNLLAKELNITLFSHTKRRHSTKSQKKLSRKERLNNINDDFVITRKLSGKSIAIIDDVMTTGSTVNNFAKALKQAGAKTVAVWALARTPP
ncbi:MAG: ComF family protein [Cellvibrionaceae bacterium]